MLLNQKGIAVLIPDLYGTGDSEGNFEQSSWDCWLEDLKCTVDWPPFQHLSLAGMLAVRSGALLAAEFALVNNTNIAASVFWQPVSRGALLVKQLLRIRSMAMAVNAGRRESVSELLERILAAETIYAGGYPLTKEVVEPLNSRLLDDLVSENLGSTYSLELVRDENRQGRFIERIGKRELTIHRFLGEPYWTATETICNRQIVEETARVLEEAIFSDP